MEKAVVGFEGVLEMDALEEIGKLVDPGVVKGSGVSVSLFLLALLPQVVGSISGFLTFA